MQLNIGDVVKGTLGWAAYGEGRVLGLSNKHSDNNHYIVKFFNRPEIWDGVVRSGLELVRVATPLEKLL